VEGALGVLYDVGTGGVVMESTWTVAMVVDLQKKKTRTFFVTLPMRHAAYVIQVKENEIIQCSLELQIEADNNTESF
jgi:hypothetical protein